MGVMDKFLNYMKLNGEEEEYLDDDFLDDDDDESPVVPPRKAQTQKIKEDEIPEERPVRRAAATNKITPIKQPSSRRGQNNTGMEVCVIKPTNVEDAREITETLLANRAVVLNLEGLDNYNAQRIIDFTSGSCFAISGNLQKISHNIFIITPASVDISGDFQDVFSDSSEMPLKNQ